MAGITAEMVLAILYTLFVLNVLMLALRCSLNLTRGHKRLRPSDYSICVCVLLQIPGVAMCTRMNILDIEFRWMIKTYGFPTPLMVYYYDDLHITNYLKFAQAAVLIGYAIVWSVKVSICVIYGEMRNNFTKKVKWAFWALWAVVVASFVVLIVVQCLQCRPFSSAWVSPEHDGYCNILTSRPLDTFLICSVVADVAMVAFAVYMFRGLKLRQSLYAALMLVVIMAAMSITASCLRWAFLHKQSLHFDPEEFMENSRRGQVWGIIEGFFGQLAATLPAFRLLLKGGDQGNGGSGGGGRGTGYQVNRGGKSWAETSAMGESRRKLREREREAMELELELEGLVDYGVLVTIERQAKEEAGGRVGRVQDRAVLRKEKKEGWQETTSMV